MQFRLAYLHLTLAKSKDQGHGHTHFDCKGQGHTFSLQMVTDSANNTIASHIHFRLSYLHFILAYSDNSEKKSPLYIYILRILKVLTPIQWMSPQIFLDSHPPVRATFVNRHIFYVTLNSYLTL